MGSRISQPLSYQPIILALSSPQSRFRVWTRLETPLNWQGRAKVNNDAATLVVFCLCQHT